MLSVNVGPVEPGLARALAASAAAHDGFDSLGEDALADIGRGPHDDAVTVVASAPGDTRAPVMLVHIRTIGTLEEPHAELRLVAAPDARDPKLLATMIRTAVLPFVDEGTEVVAWFPGAPAYADDAAEAAGFEPQRVLLRMEGPLTQKAPAFPGGVPDGVTVRTWRPEDAHAWVSLNNRAFAGHPEQGGWTIERLHDAIDHEWFDPEGFLLAIADDALVGFCWTKLHSDASGEIYVIGVDPAHQGTGLGKALTRAGLATLHAQGATRGLLYVDAGNAAAVEMYRSLGFDVTRSDAAWIRKARS